MGNEGCKTCDCIDEMNKFRGQPINPQLIKPIEFSDKHSEAADNAQNQNQNQNNKKQASTFAMNAGQQQSTIKLKIHDVSGNKVRNGYRPDDVQLQIQSKKSKSVGKHIDTEMEEAEIKVPFPVIRLIIKANILDQFVRYEKQFQKNYGDPQSHSYHTWRLQPNGLYTNRIPDGTTIILTEKFLYKGWTKIRDYVPENLGVLIKEEGSYEGNFVQGKAHGKGTFISANGKQKCTGKWFKGLLKEGKIENEKYVYEGQLQKCVPNGKGLLIGLDEKGRQIFRYFGNFVDGKFDGKGKYECASYIYNGRFEKGRKNGPGSIVFKQPEKQKRKKVQSSQIEGTTKQGEWFNDRLINERSEKKQK